MLPVLNSFLRNDVDQSSNIANQPSQVGRQMNQMGSIIQSRLGAIASPSVALQSGIFNSFGNNIATQGAVQLGGMLSDALSKLTKSFGDDDDEPEERRSQSRGRSEDEKNILKEMLKSLLRIEKSGSMGFAGSRPKLKSSAAQATDIGGNERKSAQDLLKKLDQKSPVPVRRQSEGIVQARLHNIAGNVEGSALQGVYNAFGYNPLTQLATESVGAAGDVFNKIVSKSFGSDIVAGKPTSPEEAVAEEVKSSNSILGKMLTSINSMNDTIKKYFSSEDRPISNQEKEFEDSLKKVPPPEPALPKELWDKREEKKKAEAEAKPSLLEEIIDDIPDIDIDKKTKGRGKLSKAKNIGRALKHVGRSGLQMARVAAPGAATAAIAAAPLAAMYGVSEWAGNQEHDEERVETTKGWSDTASDFFSSIGLDFKSRWKDQAEKNREGLNTEGQTSDEYKLPITPTKSSSGSKELQEKVDEASQAKAKETSQPNQTNVSKVDIKNNTIMPDRKSTRNNDASANRYLDSALRVA